MSARLEPVQVHTGHAARLQCIACGSTFCRLLIVPTDGRDTISSMDLQDTLEQVRAEIAPSI
ncbi:MAG TPA: hypothetical protein VF423_01120, partial [Actinomycetes bacterium]